MADAHPAGSADSQHDPVLAAGALGDEAFAGCPVVEMRVQDRFEGVKRVAVPASYPFLVSRIRHPEVPPVRSANKKDAPVLGVCPMSHSVHPATPIVSTEVRSGAEIMQA